MVDTARKPVNPSGGIYERMGIRTLINGSGAATLVGGTRMRSTARFGVTPGPGASGSAVAIDGTVEVSGRMASLIEGGATLVVKRMSGEFAERLAARCAAEAR